MRHSEGQGIGLLLAAHNRDRATFDVEAGTEVTRDIRAKPLGLSKLRRFGCRAGTALPSPRMLQ